MYVCIGIIVYNREETYALHEYQIRRVCIYVYICMYISIDLYVIKKNRTRCTNIRSQERVYMCTYICILAYI